jgi:hypothetical protein
MFARRALATVVLLTVAALAPCCSSETIILLSVPATDAGAPVAPIKCSATSGNCPSDYYCLLPTGDCSSEAGTCTPIPPTCPGDAGTDDSTEDPVCGCDGITYWNSCLLRRYGVSPATPTGQACPPENPNTPPCGVPGATCADGTWCALLGGSGMHGDPCAHPIPGTCWVLPAKCPPPGVFLWDSCSSTGAICLDTCNAIKAGGPYRGSLQCQSQ